MEPTKDLMLLQKIVTIMACEQAMGVPLDEMDVDPKFVRKAIVDGHLWALYWEGYDNLLHETPKKIADEVGHILTMWRMIHYSYSELSDRDREDFLAEEMVFARPDVPFPGFDGNAEAAHLGAARFMIEELNRFQEQKGRDLNSHWPVLEGYRRMLHKFDSFPQRYKRLSKDEMIELFKSAHAKEQGL